MRMTSGIMKCELGESRESSVLEGFCYRAFIRCLVNWTAAALIAGTALASKSFAEERIAILAHMFPETSLPGEVATRFAQDLAALDGLAVRVAGDGLLGDERHNVRQMVAGEIEFAITGDLFIGTMLPAFQAMSLPFVNTSFEAAATLHESSVRSDLEAAMRDYGLTVLSRHCIGQRFLTASRPISTVDELAGLTLRLPPDPVWTKVWTALGANVVTIPFTKLKDALARGDVEAQENPPTLIRTAELYEVQPFLIRTKHYVQYQYILASSSLFNSMAADQQAAIKRAAERASQWGCEKAKAQQESEVRWLVSEGGMKAIDFDAGNAKARALSLKASLPVAQAQSVLDALH